MAKAVRILIAALIVGIIVLMFTTGRFSWSDLEYQTLRYFRKGKSAVEKATGVAQFKASHAHAKQCRENLRLIERTKRRVADETGMTVGFVTPQQIQSALGGEIPTCPSGGKYFINQLVQLPTCSIGAGSDALSKQDDHLITNY